jgi:hypothetical protein
VGKNAFVNADGVLTSWGYVESNKDDTKIAVSDDFVLEIGQWKYDNGDWVEYIEDLSPLEVLADKIADELELEPKFRLIFEAMFRMENRIRVLEGKQAITKATYWTAVKAVYVEINT